jgi:uncharacterized protein with PQ loop repeat
MFLTERSYFMELFRAIMSWSVVIIGLTAWSAFLPQIKLLIKTKEAKSVSVGLFWISFGMQVTVLTYLIIQPSIDWKLALSYITCIICQVVIIGMIYYYRKWPGGR